MLHVLPTASFCTISTAHENCDHSIDEYFFVCDSSILDDANKSLRWYRIVLFFNIAMIVLPMIIIIVTIFNKSRKINSLKGEERNISNLRHDPENGEKSIIELRHSRVMVIQAFLYIFTFCITWVFILAIQLFQMDENTKNLMLYFRTIFRPIQGLWNLIIFVYDKAYVVYHNNNDKGYWSAIKSVLVHPATASSIIILPSSLENCSNDDRSDKDKNILDPPDREGTDESILHSDSPAEDPPANANAILRTMYRNQSRVNAASQGQQGNMDSMAIIKLLYEKNPDFHYDRTPYYSSSISNSRATSFRGANPGIVEVDGRRGSWVYLNPSDRTNNASIIEAEDSNSTRRFSKALSNYKGATMENIEEEIDSNIDDMASDKVKS